MNTNPNDPSNPCPNTWTTHCGLTKREEIAKAALVGLLASPKALSIAGSEQNITARMYARIAVLQADALIAAFNEPSSEGK